MYLPQLAKGYIFLVLLIVHFVLWTTASANRKILGVEYNKLWIYHRKFSAKNTHQAVLHSNSKAGWSNVGPTSGQQNSRKFNVGLTPTAAWAWLTKHDVINGNIFHITGPLCGKPPVTSEFSSQRPVTGSFDVFFDLYWINSWVNNREAGDLRCHCPHYYVIVMRQGCLSRVQIWSPFHKSQFKFDGKLFLCVNLL